MSIQTTERPTSHLFYVRRLRRPLVDRAALEITTPDEARAMLALKGGDRVAF